jgi:pSer/pThr/pTyr-binding forkhead associated (FHA) protein
MTEKSKSSVFTVESSPMTDELRDKELERQLSLFQLFRKLYEHHSGLLDEILRLENLDQRSLTSIKPHYLQGVVDASVACVITNLCENKTQRLQQPQGIWTIGRDSNSGIHIADQYISDRHAAIQYIDEQGFYLIDFNSANGSFVNGEPVYQPMQLKDGDRIRLGSITFNFFMEHTCRTLPTVAVELLMQLVPRINANSAKILNRSHEMQKHPAKNLNDSVEVARKSGLMEDLKYHQHDGFSAEDKSDILERLFNKQTLYDPS